MSEATPSEVLITIDWPGRTEDKKPWLAANEQLSIDLSSLQRGDWVETIATFPGFPAPTRYAAKCVDFSLSDERYSLTLDFQKEGNCDLVEDADIRYGKNFIRFNRDLSGASAVFKPDKAEELLASSCKVSQIALFSTLARASVEILLRPGQSNVRKELLAIGAPHSCCAVSGESLEDALELAHVIAHSKQGACSTSNAFLLRADLHILFDAGKLHISADDGSISLLNVPKESGYHLASDQWAPKLSEAVFKRIRKALFKRASERSASP